MSDRQAEMYNETVSSHSVDEIGRVACNQHNNDQYKCNDNDMIIITSMTKNDMFCGILLHLMKIYLALSTENVVSGQKTYRTGLYNL